MSHPYLPQSDSDLERIYQTLGISRFDELISSIPEEFLVKEPLPIPGPMEERELWNRFLGWSEKNGTPPEFFPFVGGGAYFHYIPKAVLHIASKPEFFTTYTPYQPEVSQGTLTAIFEFQTMVCELTGLEVANASMYDGATALAEAILMARRIRPAKKLLLPATLHPFYRRVVETYLRHIGIQILTIPYDPQTGALDLQELAQSLDEDVFAVVIQSPNFFGVIEDAGEIARVLSHHPALKIYTFTEALSLGILIPPGKTGFDIAVGEGQSLGVPLNFGGPHLGLFSTRKEYLRRIPGRIAGWTTDQDGRRGFVLTLSTREQHIRREKATSNICTNEGLCALMMTAYLSLMGPQGLRNLASKNARLARSLRSLLMSFGFSLPFEGPFFNEFVVEHPEAPSLYEELLKERIILGIPLKTFFPEMERALLVCATEIHEGEGMEKLEKALKKLLGKRTFAPL
jgi:glycine dehydrogenase subunit 1